MTFQEELERGAFPVALEITPPQQPLPAVLLRRARLLGTAACAVNVIQRPGRQTSLQASCVLASAGVQPAWHLVTRGRTHADILADLRVAAAAGVQQVLCIRGDHVGPDQPGAPTIREATALAVEHLPGAYAGATLNQYGDDVQAVRKNLEGKIKAGAAYVQTQPVFAIEDSWPALEWLRERWPATRVVAMAMPLLTEDAAAKIEARLGIALPPSLRRAIAGGEGAAWECFTETLAGLAASPLVDGVAIMTFEMDPAAATGERIVACLRAAKTGLSGRSPAGTTIGP
ncbi:MAG: methylenetetrahydrofolate reductase [Tepidiformaceae bacterium]